jgi:hypothetical protein
MKIIIKNLYIVYEFGSNPKNTLWKV